MTKPRRGVRAERDSPARKVGLEGATASTSCFAIYQRIGVVATFPAANRRWASFRPITERHTERGSIYHTDVYQAYPALKFAGSTAISGTNTSVSTSTSTA